MCTSDERLTWCNDNSDCVSCVINDVVTFAYFYPDCGIISYFVRDRWTLSNVCVRRTFNIV
jgi:hypothetical protein